MPRYAELPPWASGEAPTDENGEVAPENRRSSKSEPQPRTLNPWYQEKRTQHRALLLLAMQDPGSNRSDGPNGKGVCDGRSLEAVAKTLVGEVSRSAVRAWFKRKSWSDRIVAHGPDAQRYAIRLYRRLYLQEHGRGDMEALAPLISLPVSSAGSRELEETTDVQSKAVALLQRVLNGGEDADPLEAPEEVHDAVQQAWEDRRKRARDQNDALRKTILQAIRALQNSIRAAVDPAWAKLEENQHVVPVKVRLADFPRLLRSLRELEEEEARLLGLQVSTEAGSVPDTARVAIAKELGQPVLPAILEDLAEATLICRQLIARPVALEDLQVEQTQATTQASKSS